MKYFDIETIKNSIERLQNFSANWLLPTFVFAANDVGTDELVDMSTRLGTDQFLDRYFNGKRLGIKPTPRGNNLLRPRLKGIKWDSGDFAGDHVIRQDTKMWGNLFSSRGYREMRLQGLIEGEKSVVRLTDEFQPRFEQEVPSSFRFEDFLVWLFAFEGIPDELESWADLYDYLLNNELKLTDFKAPYKNRFTVNQHDVPWPAFLNDRPSDNEFLEELAPKLLKFLTQPVPDEKNENQQKDSETLGDDDDVYAAIKHAINAGESLAFLLAGPPGTGKTHYARRLANTITNQSSEKLLFLQFHPAIGYDDFVEGFRPEVTNEGAGITYSLAPRIFMKFAKKALDNPTESYVAVIDELNRGDVARVFGEVLTYLEVDYRGKEFTLPFSGDITVLPHNLIVIATANPYDRSVTDLDDALLRRFWVIDLEPSESILKQHLQSQNLPSEVINRTLYLFRILNDVFPHGFGHTNFLKVTSVEDLSAIWSGKVLLPLRRALIHDKAAFDETKANVEQLFRGIDESDQNNPDD